MRDHKSQWMLEHGVHGENGLVVGSALRLTLTGEQSIAHTLFAEPDRLQTASQAAYSPSSSICSTL